MKRRAVPILATLIALSGCADNMYPTDNYKSDCSDGDPGSGFCQTDNNLLRFCFESSVRTAAKYAILSVLGLEFDPTDLEIQEDSSCSYSGDAETDIVYQVKSAGVPSGKDGITWCNDAVTNRRCDQHYVRFKTSTVAAHTGLICHETGHAVGLTHGAQASPKLSNTDPSLGCMVTPVAAGVGLGGNNAYWINLTYHQ